MVKIVMFGVDGGTVTNDIPITINRVLVNRDGSKHGYVKGCGI